MFQFFEYVLKVSLSQNLILLGYVSQEAEFLKHDTDVLWIYNILIYKFHNQIAHFDGKRVVEKRCDAVDGIIRGQRLLDLWNVLLFVLLQRLDMRYMQICSVQPAQQPTGNQKPSSRSRQIHRQRSIM